MKSDLDISWRQTVPFALQDQPPIIWTRGEGAYVFDEDNRSYLDFTSANFAATLGYNHQSLQKAIFEVVHSGLLATYQFPNKYHIELGNLLVSLEPSQGHNRVLLLTSGSEAIDAAIRACRCWRKSEGRRYKILCFKKAFHGRTLGAWTASDSGCLRCGSCYSKDDSIKLPFPSTSDNNDFLKEINPNDLACVLIEPYQGRSGLFFPMAFIEKLRSWCDLHSVPLIADEIQSGFGRTGRLFAMEHYGVKADLTVFGKGLAGGLPVSAVVGNQEILNSIPSGGCTTTHGGNPVCTACAIACVRYLIENEIPMKVEKLGEIIAVRLEEMSQVQKNNTFFSFTGRGLVWALHFPNNPTIANRLVEHAIKKGLLLFSPIGDQRQTIKLCPPLIITIEQLEKGLVIIRQALLEITEVD